jgi:type II secretion system protein H
LESRQLIDRGANAMTRAQRGFTLIEIMVVVVIIGILVIGAILSLGATGKDSGLQQERDRLAALIAYGRERGAMLTLEYGIRCGEHGYRFVFYDNRVMQWSPETVDDTLHLRRLPAGLQLRLVIEGHPIVLDDKALLINPSAAVTLGGKPTLPGSSGSSGGMAGITGSGGIASAFGSSGGFGSSSGFSSGGGFSSSSSSGFGGSGYGSSGGGFGSSSGGGYGSSSGGGYGSSSGGGLNDQAQDDTPQIMLFSNGDTNTFALTIERVGVGRSVTLQSADDGTVTVGDIVEVKQ